MVERPDNEPEWICYSEQFREFESGDEVWYREFDGVIEIRGPYSCEIPVFYAQEPLAT